MKKLMFAMAAVAAGVAVADVTSSNIVGYNTIQIKEQWTIMSVNFAKVDGTNLKINEAFPYSAGMTKGAGITAGDNIQIQDGTGGYKTYYMSNGKAGKATYPTDEMWVDTANTKVAATVELAPGTAFWYMAQNYATPFNVTVAGSVAAMPEQTIAINQEWTHIANAYPVALDLNEHIGYQAGMTKGAGITAGDNIQIQDGAGGYKTYYMSNGKAGKATYPTDEKWVDTANTKVAATASIPVGKGAWYKRLGTSDFTITVARPFAAQ